MTAPLDLLRTTEPNYQPSTQTAELIGDKNLIAFIGAFAVGKTTLIETIASRHKDYTEVISFTTRPSRGLGDNYRFLSHGDETLELLARKAANGELINLAVILRLALFMVLSRMITNLATACLQLRLVATNQIRICRFVRSDR